MHISETWPEKEYGKWHVCCEILHEFRKPDSLTSTKNSKEYTLPPGQGVKKVIFFSFFVLQEVITIH